MNPSKRKRVEEIKRDLNYQYMNRENYLKGFKTLYELDIEIDYLMRRLEDEKDVLLIAILEMKLKDLYDVAKVRLLEDKLNGIYGVQKLEKEGN